MKTKEVENIIAWTYSQISESYKAWMDANLTAEERIGHEAWMAVNLIEDRGDLNQLDAAIAYAQSVAPGRPLLELVWNPITRAVDTVQKQKGA